jgi:hypothetical protein
MNLKKKIDWIFFFFVPNLNVIGNQSWKKKICLQVLRTFSI